MTTSLFSTMPTMIDTGREWIRINPSNNRIEYSTSRGSSWCTRYSGSYCGTFKDLLLYKGYLYAATNKGLYYSSSNGSSWCAKYSGSYCGEFLSLMDGGRELLATTTNGLYYSTSDGSSWCKRR